jgi:hypothetical protein
MASLDKTLFKAWIDQPEVETIEQVFVALFAALEQLNAGKRMNTGGNLEVQYDASNFWSGLNQKCYFLRAYMLIDASYETSALPTWANMINEVPEIPSGSFGNVFKIVN